MFGIGHFPELIVVLVVALIVFGPGKLPEIGRSLGKGIRGFREATSELERTLTGTFEDPLPPPAPPPTRGVQPETEMTAAVGPPEVESQPTASMAPTVVGSAGGSAMHPETPSVHLDHPAPVTPAPAPSNTEHSAERSAVVGIPTGAVPEAAASEASPHTATGDHGVAAGPHPRQRTRRAVQAGEAPAGGQSGPTDADAGEPASSIPPTTRA